MTIVVDANILIAFALADEPLHSQADQILSAWHSRQELLTAPRLFRSEVTAVLAQLLRYPLEFHEDDDLLKEAYELAVRFNRPRAYDTQYIALAQRLDGEFWTADERLVNSMQGQFPKIRWLGNWNATA